MADRDKTQSDDSSEDFLEELGDLLDGDLDMHQSQSPDAMPDLESADNDETDELDESQSLQTVAGNIDFSDQLLDDLPALTETDELQLEDETGNESLDDETTEQRPAVADAIDANETLDSDQPGLHTPDVALERQLHATTDDLDTEGDSEEVGEFAELELSDEAFEPLETLTEATPGEGDDIRLLDTVDFSDANTSHPLYSQPAQDTESLDDFVVDESSEIHDEMVPVAQAEGPGYEDVEITVDATADDRNSVDEIETADFIELEDFNTSASPLNDDDLLDSESEEFLTDQPVMTGDSELMAEEDPFDEEGAPVIDSESALNFASGDESESESLATFVNDAETPNSIEEEPTFAEESAVSEGKSRRMPFDLQQNAVEGAEQIMVAPLVPPRRNRALDVAKILVGTLVGAIVLQAGLWWGIGADPIGLAKLVPSSMSWMLPDALGQRNLVLRPTQPSTPADTIEEEDPDLSLTPAERVPELPSENQAANETATKSEELNNEEDFVPTNRDDEFEAGAGSSTDSVPSPQRDDLDFEPAAEPPDAAPMLPADSPASRELADSNFQPTEDRRPADPLPDSGEQEANDTRADSDLPLGSSSMEQATEPGAEGGSLAAVPEPLALDGMQDASMDRVVPLGAPSYSRNELATAIAAARDADQSLTDARINRSEDLVKKAEQFYRSFAALAETATFVNRDGSDQVLNSARDLIRSFEFDEKKQRMIANATRNWMKAKLGAGVFAAVSVTEIVPKGELFEIKATLQGKEATPLVLLTPIDPAGSDATRFVAGDRILLLGTIIEEPDRKIEGYLGAAQTVIWFTDLVVPIP